MELSLATNDWSSWGLQLAAMSGDVAATIS
jgi:hypothetical protein